MAKRMPTAPVVVIEIIEDEFGRKYRDIETATIHHDLLMALRAVFRRTGLRQFELHKHSIYLIVPSRDWQRNPNYNTVGEVYSGA